MVNQTSCLQISQLMQFAEALLDQIAVELNEEKEISELASKISEDQDFPKNFTDMEDFTEQNFPIMSEKIHDFTSLNVDSNIVTEFLDLKEFKLLKGKKVYATNQSREFVNELFSAVADEDIKKISTLQETEIPVALEVEKIPGLSNELKQKLLKIKPETIGQASRISEITPAAISILMIYIKKNELVSASKT